LLAEVSLYSDVYSQLRDTFSHHLGTQVLEVLIFSDSFYFDIHLGTQVLEILSFSDSLYFDIICHVVYVRLKFGCIM